MKLTKLLGGELIGERVGIDDEVFDGPEKH